MLKSHLQTLPKTERKMQNLEISLILHENLLQQHFQLYLKIFQLCVFLRNRGHYFREFKEKLPSLDFLRNEV